MDVHDVTYKVISSLLFRVLYHEFCVSTVVQSVMKLKNRCEENSLDKNIKACIKFLFAGLSSFVQ